MVLDAGADSNCTNVGLKFPGRGTELPRLQEF